MKLSLFMSFIGAVGAFDVKAPTQHYNSYRKLDQRSLLSRSAKLFTSTREGVSGAASVSIDAAKEDLLDVAHRLKSDYGTFVIDKSAQDELKRAVENLELVAKDLPQDPADLIGDWTLICTTASASSLEGIDTSKLPFFNEGPIKDVRKMLNKSLKVEQRVMSSSENMSSNDEDADGSSFFNRIDHVIEYQPPSKLTEFLENVPEPIKALNINPLQVSTGKFVLIHKAELESAIPVLKTKLSLSSVVGTFFTHLHSIYLTICGVFTRCRGVTSLRAVTF